MFQKLYKNLEEINSRGLEQTGELRQTREAILKLTEQLAMAASAASTPVQAEPSEIPGRTIPFEKTHLIVLGIEIFLLAMIAFLAFRTVQTDQKLLQTEAVRLDSGRQADAYIRGLSQREENLKGKETVLERRMSNQDSLLVAEQQSINELIKLNNTAVHTFNRIRKDLEQRDQPVSALK